MPVKVSELFPEPSRVPWGDRYLEVRGLGLEEVTGLIQGFRGDFLRMMVLVRQGESGVLELVNACPKLVTMILGIATDSIDDEVEMRHVRRIPAGVQVLAVPEVWRLTVSDQKKIQELLSGLRELVRKHLPQLDAKVTAAISTVSPQTSEP